MRHFQKGVFVIGVLSFLASGLFIGGFTGDALWRAGVAAMLVVLAWTRLWPGATTR